MATTPVSPRSLPQKPSSEYLRKQAKRLARNELKPLATAQHQLARDYGYRTWAALMSAVHALASANGGGAGENNSHPDDSSTRAGAPTVFPLLPLRGLVAFPHTSYPI